MSRRFDQKEMAFFLAFAMFLISLLTMPSFDALLSNKAFQNYDKSLWVAHTAQPGCRINAGEQAVTKGLEKALTRIFSWQMFSMIHYNKQKQTKYLSAPSFATLKTLVFDGDVQNRSCIRLESCRRHDCLSLRGGGLIKAKSKLKQKAKKKGKDQVSKVWWIAEELKKKPKGRQETKLDLDLMAACRANNVTEIQRLIEQGAEINARCTPCPSC